MSERRERGSGERERKTEILKLKCEVDDGIERFCVLEDFICMKHVQRMKSISGRFEVKSEQKCGFSKSTWIWKIVRKLDKILCATDIFLPKNCKHTSDADDIRRLPFLSLHSTLLLYSIITTILHYISLFAAYISLTLYLSQYKCKTWNYVSAAVNCCCREVFFEWSCGEGWGRGIDKQLW